MPQPAPDPFIDPSINEARMQLALDQAREAEQAGEVPVGAVLFLGDRLVASGQNRVLRDNDPTAHAEVVALRLAGQSLGNYRLPQTTLYCTLEPCAMCAGAMMHARVQRLVFATPDPKAGAAGSVLSVLNHPRLNHSITVETGPLAKQCGGLLRAFFQARRRSTAEAGEELNGIITG